MKRIKLIIQYDGTNYAGWQSQDNSITIQDVLAGAIFKSCGTKKIISAGRTDRGVHAMGQAVHFDTDSNIPADKLHHHLNAVLPDDIRILSSKEVNNDFHARFDAVLKHYRYTVYTEKNRPPIYRNYSGHAWNLDIDRIKKAIPMLIGEKDFGAFMDKGSPVNLTIRNMKEVYMEEDGVFLHFNFKAQSFLYHQIRIMTGTLLNIGLNRLDENTIIKAIETGRRDLLGPTITGAGLNLISIKYPEE